MAIQDIIYQRIKEEITNDPDKLGYATKTDQEVYDLIMGKVITQETITVEKPQPMLRIIDAIVNGPNFITKEDITNAKAVI